MLWPAGQIVYCQDEVDAAYIQAVHSQSLPGPRNLKIIYSPLHGVGASAVLPVLAANGFADVELFGPHAEPDRRFSECARPCRESRKSGHLRCDHRASPRGAGRPDSGQRSRTAIASGCAAPLTADSAGSWAHALPAIRSPRCWPIICSMPAAGRAHSRREHYVVKTLVTTEMVRRIADYYGVRTLGNLQVGFKYIGHTIDEVGPEQFRLRLRGVARLSGRHATPATKTPRWPRCCWPSWPPRAKARGQSLHERLDALYIGNSATTPSSKSSVTLPGSQGHEANPSADGPLPQQSAGSSWPD